MIILAKKMIIRELEFLLYRRLQFEKILPFTGEEEEEKDNSHSTDQ